MPPVRDVSASVSRHFPYSVTPPAVFKVIRCPLSEKFLHHKGFCLFPVSRHFPGQGLVSQNVAAAHSGGGFLCMLRIGNQELGIENGFLYKLREETNYII